MTVGTIEKKQRRNAPARDTPVASGRGWLWALAQIAVIGIEIFALLFVLAQPAFRPRHLVVTGNRHLTAAQVTDALNLPSDRNIFLLRPADLAKRLRGLPWVRTAGVSLALPDRLSVKVIEWTPLAVLQVGEATYYLNDLGEVLDPAAEAGGLTVINRPGFGPARDGQQAIGSDLLPMLIQLRAAFAPAFKVSVTSFELDQREVLTAQTDRGWTIVFGQMVTRGDRASLEPKLAALRALSSRIDLVAAPIQYINLENPRAPAVQMRAHR